MPNEPTSELSQKIARERAELAAAVVPVRLTAEAIERRVNALRYFATHPVSLAVAAVLVIALSRNRYGKLLRNGLIGWRFFRALKR
ncbi:MAG TPA: YqjK family protein [Burkholderiales bacterium]|nr:YqjK family protein [Burkholderiales bacterium]